MKLPKLTWRQPGGLAECPYFHRWVLDFGPFAVRVHHWHADDDHRAFHDHPYWLFIVVLRGGYKDVSPIEPLKVPELGPDSWFNQRRDFLRRFSVRFRPARYKHSVQDVVPGTVSLLITGRPFRRWGFWVGGKLIKRDKYFVTRGHHPCDPHDEPVRIKPGGERVGTPVV